MLPSLAMHIRNTYAITTVTAQRRALLQSTQNAELLLNTLFNYRDQHRFELHGFAIMPENIHILLTPAIDQTIERCAQCIKGGFSHALPIKPIGGVWQPSFHQHRIRDAEDFQNQLTYIAQNPTRRNLQNHLWTHTNHPTKIDVNIDLL
jgi:putative transposase